jgi:serine/threonine protein kinase
MHTAQLKDSLRLSSTCCVTLSYVSPEMMKNQLYKFNTDVWSAGCVLFEMIMLRKAFDNKDQTKLKTMIESNDPLSDVVMNPIFKDLLYELVSFIHFIFF